MQQYVIVVTIAEDEDSRLFDSVEELRRRKRDRSDTNARYKHQRYPDV
jgi:hypothetical protein